MFVRIDIPFEEEDPSESLFHLQTALSVCVCVCVCLFWDIKKMYASHLSTESVPNGRVTSKTNTDYRLDSNNWLEMFLENVSLTIVPNQSILSNVTVGNSFITPNRTYITTSTGDTTFNPPWNIQLLWSIVFGVMITVGLIANILVIATIGGHKSLHTVTNCFLLNLTVSDLVTLLINAIFNFVYMLIGHWPFGKVYCVVNNFITNLTIAISVFTIMFTSKER